MQFDKDLQFGQKYERLALKYFKYNKAVYPKGKFKEYDLILDDEIKVEVKADRLAHKTGNVAIEFECNNRPSGLSVTEAHYIVYFILYECGEACYKIPVNRLKKICRKYGRVVYGGDRKASKMFLISLDKLQKYKSSKLIKNEALTLTFN